MAKQKYDIKKDIKELQTQLLEISHIKELTMMPGWDSFESLIRQKIEQNMVDVAALTLETSWWRLMMSAREISMKRNLAYVLDEVFNKLKHKLNSEQFLKDQLKEKTAIRDAQAKMKG